MNSWIESISFSGEGRGIYSTGLENMFFSIVIIDNIVNHYYIIDTPIYLSLSREFFVCKQPWTAVWFMNCTHSYADRLKTSLLWNFKDFWGSMLSYRLAVLYRYRIRQFQNNLCSLGILESVCSWYDDTRMNLWRFHVVSLGYRQFQL